MRVRVWKNSESLGITPLPRAEGDLSDCACVFPIWALARPVNDAPPPRLQTRCLIDTGASQTMLLRQVVEALRLPIVGSTIFHGFAAPAGIAAEVARVMLAFWNGAELPWCAIVDAVVRDDLPEGVLMGMDLIASQGLLTIDGPGNRWALHIADASRLPSGGARK